MTRRDNHSPLWDLLSMFNQWEEIQEICERVIGEGVQIIGPSGRNVSERQYNSQFCQLVLDSKVGYQRCVDSYQQGCFSKSAIKDGFSVFTCHAGLTNLAYPLVIDQKPVAAIVGGGILAGEGAAPVCDAGILPASAAAALTVAEQWYLEFAHVCGINPQRLLDALVKITRISMSEFAAMGQMLKQLIDPLKDEIVRHYLLAHQARDISGEVFSPADKGGSQTAHTQCEQLHLHKKRCVITGIGVISPIGFGRDNFWQALCSGRSGVSQIEVFDASTLPVRIAGEIKDFKPQEYMNTRSVKRSDRATQFAISAGKLAVEDSGLSLSKEAKDRVQVIIGAGVGGLAFAEKQVSEFLQFGAEKVSPYLSIIAFSGALSSMVSLELGLKGASITVSTGCPAGTDAIGYGFRAIQSGESDVVIAGGAESPIRPVVIASFYAMNALSLRNDDPTRASRPFDLSRDGFVIGEGSGVVVIEELNHALKRGAHIYGEIIGYATSNDAYHMTAPAPDGESAVRAFKTALKEAGVKPGQINYINPHGSSTPLGDRTETMVIKKVFGQDACKIPISSTKSMLGHSIGATGAIELIVCALAVDTGIIPPTINYETPDPDCDLDYVPNIARQAEVNLAFSNSFGFGGKNSALVVRRCMDGAG